MNILVIGSGGREHAIAKYSKLSKNVETVFVAPGNDGMKNFATVVNIAEDNNQELIKFSKSNNIELVIVGPENALSNGIVDEFKKANIAIFGPTKKASKIESSKEYAKALMEKYNIPTASYKVFNNYEKSIDYVNTISFPCVLKYDGLAAGKGVVIANNLEEAKNTLKDMLLDKKFGNENVIIEEFLDGIEFSLIAFVNKDKVYPMELSQDYKRAFDNDQGLNTGGMGAYSPVSEITHLQAQEGITIVENMAKAMLKEDNEFCGFLYGGLITTNDGVKVIEFNARLGDPETQVLLPRLKSDFIEVIQNVLNEKPVTLEWDDDAVVGVVMASKGYPINYEKGYPINSLAADEDDIYHMGTKFDEQFYTNGGRVLFVSSKGKSISKARHNVYNKLSEISCSNLFYRMDIAKDK